MPIHRLTASAPYVSILLTVGQNSGNYIALLDTGASMSAVDPDVVRALRPSKVGSVAYIQVGFPSQ